jgi:GR25 family glycosyltransferase involved in LPS biosynthesis
MSHIKVWEKFVAMGASAREPGEATPINGDGGDDGEDALVLILEDDVRFHKQWQPMLVDIIAALRAIQGGVDHWSGLLYLDAMDTTGWDLSKKGLVV